MKNPAILLAACLILASCTHESPSPPDQMIDIGSHRLQIHREGHGSPTVVIDTGIGDQLDKLIPLQQQIAEITLTVTYNRAGYGRSEAGPQPRDGAREAEELKTLLEKASVKGPYVLVGHSLGALNVQVFAARYPHEVAGMVLLDPPPLSFILGKEYKDLGAMAEKMTAQWQAAGDSAATSADPRDRAQSVFLRMIASEHHEMFGETAKMVEGIATFGDIPLVVIASGKPNPAFGAIAGEFQKFWIQQSRDLASKSSRGTFILAKGSSHYLYMDAPDLVAGSILSLVHDIRGK